MTECTVFLKPPSDFLPRVEAAGCYCEFEDKILLLKRQSNTLQANTWCTPGGKLEKEEDARAAIIREMQEEIGVEIDDTGLKKMGQLYVRLPQTDYVFYMFRRSFAMCPIIKLDLKEHREAQWVTIHEALQLSLIAGGKESLKFYREFIHANP